MPPGYIAACVVVAFVTTNLYSNSLLSTLSPSSSAYSYSLLPPACSLVRTCAQFKIISVVLESFLINLMSAISFVDIVRRFFEAMVSTALCNVNVEIVQKYVLELIKCAALMRFN